jgi:baculoviral IAP repeat-containing protein 7/8
MASGRIPLFPQYGTFAARYHTYAGWPTKATNVKPRDLASAGFFYTGKEDKTRCFHCGGGLDLWSNADSPIDLHATYFPRCAYIDKVNKNF